MTTEIEQNYPASGWISGFPLSPSHWTTEVEDSDQTLNFNTLNAIGEFAPQGALPEWSLTLPLPDNVDAQAVHLFSNGYRIVANNGNLDVIVLAPGAILGSIPTDVQPTLFCGDHETQDSGNGTGIFTDEIAVYLETQDTAGGKRFALIHGQTSETSITIAEMLLAYNSAELIDNELLKRSTYFRDVQEASTEKRPLSKGIILAPECLVNSLRGANATYPDFWMQSASEKNMNMNTLYSSILGWLSVDIEIAKGLLNSALSTQNETGIIPSQPSNEEGDVAWPLIVRSAAALFAKTDDLEWLAEIFHALENYLQASINHFDPKLTGLPQWPSDHTCITPEVWDEELSSIDLAGLLRAECSTLARLAKRLEHASAPLALTQEYKETLDRSIDETFWNPEQKVYMDRYTSGAFVSRCSAGALWPLLSNADNPHREENTRSILRRKKLLNESGLLSWEAWDQDEVQPTCDPLIQNLAIEVLDHPSAREDHQLLIQNILSRFERLFDQGQPFPTAVDTGSANSTAYFDPLEASSIMTCWREQSDTVQTYEQYPRIVRWMDARRLTITFLLSLFIASFVLLVGNYYAKKNSFTAGLAQTYSGLAKHMKNMGDDEQAIELFSHVLSRTTQKPLIVHNEIELANVYFKTQEFEKARELYQKALDSDVMEAPQRAAPLWNLGQTTYRMGKHDEATRLFNQFIEQYETLYPSLSKRAELTLHLIEDELERQRYKK